MAATERLRRALGDDLTGGDDRNPVRQALGLLHVVRGQEDRLAQPRRPSTTSHAARRADGIKARRRLVEEDQLGIPDQCERDVETAALPTGQRGSALGRLRTETDERHRFIDVARLG